MVDTGIQQNVCPSMDDSMAVVMAYLPTTLGDENENEFSQAIHEILKETFNISPADVKSVSKMASGNTPVLKANPGFGMNCKIVFRSCDLLSRVIAEKSKLVAPTTIHTLDEVTSHLEGMNVHQQHQYQHQEHHDDPEAARVEEGGTGDAGVSPQSVHTAADSLLLSPTISSELYRVQPSLSSGESVMTSTNEAVDCAARESRHCQDSAITTAMGCDGSARNHDSLTTNTTICSAQPTSEDMNKHKECVGDGDSERSDTLGEKEEVLEESAGRDSGNDDKVGLEKNNEANENKESFTKVLDDWRNWPIDKEGAPLFEFRKCAGQNEKRSIMIDNALPSDLYNPWIHAATQRARQIDTCFMQLYALESTKNGYGRILLSFSDDTAVMSAVINNLIHVRTHNCRRLRVFLPLTKGTMKQRQEIEKRQGHLREFPFSMRQLILKPLRDDVTEEHIRNEAFRDHEIEAVEFKQDLLGQRCALLTFKSASRAVLAHCANNYVPFGDTKNGDKWIRVLSCYVAIKESSTAASHDGLLTRNELKTYVEKKKDERFKGVKVDGAANGVHDGDHEDAGKARNIEPAASSLTSSGSDKVKGEVGADKAREEKSRIDRSVKKSSMRWNGSRRSTDAMRAESISGKRKRARVSFRPSENHAKRLRNISEVNSIPLGARPLQSGPPVPLMRVDSRPGMSVRRGPISTRGSEYDRYGGPSPRPLFDEFETSRHRMSRDPYAIRANDVLRFGPRVPAQQGLGRLSSDAADSYDSMRKPYVPRLLDDFARQPLPFDSREYSRESSGTSLNRSGWSRSYNPTYGFSYAAGWQ